MELSKKTESRRKQRQRWRRRQTTSNAFCLLRVGLIFSNWTRLRGVGVRASDEIAPGSGDTARKPRNIGIKPGTTWNTCEKK
jgi:hypothetical protein